MKGLGVIASVVLVVACGARTGLYAPDDASLDIDATSRVDAALDADADTTVSCTPGDITLVAAEPEVMFVLDRSGSMRSNFSGNQTRWQVLTNALAATLPPVDSTMAIGALLFPSGSSTDDCSVPSQPNLSPAFGQVQALVNLMQANQPGGATPTADAIGVAASLLLTVRAATGSRALVLATDGGPNCNASLNPATCTCVQAGNGCHHDANQCLDDARTVKQIADVFAEGIPTYVIGIADTGDATFENVLDAMANAGGRPLTNGATTYYPARNASDLQNALTAIRDQVGACTYLTTSVPDAAGSIVVTLDGQTIPFSPDGGAAGWSWSDEGNGELVLLGATCTQAATEPNASLVAHVVCSGDD